MLPSFRQVLVRCSQSEMALTISHLACEFLERRTSDPFGAAGGMQADAACNRRLAVVRLAIQSRSAVLLRGFADKKSKGRRGAAAEAAWREG